MSPRRSPLRSMLLWMGAMLALSGLAHAGSQPLPRIHLDSEGMPRCVETGQGARGDFLLLWSQSRASREGREVHAIRLADIGASQERGHTLHRYCGGWRQLVNPAWISPGRIEVPPEASEIFGVSLDDRTRRALKQLRAGGNRFREEEAVEAYLRAHPLTPFDLDQNSRLVRDHGLAFANEAYRKWVRSKIPKDTPCTSYIGSCDYYLCRERKLDCGAEGYPVGFGYQYCSGSLEVLIHRVSAQGAEWLVQNARCLQTALDRVPDPRSCQELKDAAVDSHAQCYLSSGFCELPFTDKLEILGLVGRELTDRKILSQSLEVMNSCSQAPTPPLSFDSNR